MSLAKAALAITVIAAAKADMHGFMLIRIIFPSLMEVVLRARSFFVHQSDAGFEPVQF